MAIQINREIPATMSDRGLEYLAQLAQSVPENGVIVEVGPLFGSSTWVLSKNAPSSAKIFSIDTWEPAAWIDKIEKRYRACKPFSKDAFLYYTRDCHNVTAIQGWSPDVVSEWDLPIDLFFDDATHGDPGFSANINHFLPFVKDAAIICGDDYSKGWPDIVTVVDKLADNWNTNAEVIGRVWSMRKPNSESDQAEKVNLSICQNHSTPIINIETNTLSGKSYINPPEVWSGATHKKDRLSNIYLDLYQPSDPDIKLIWAVQTNDGVLHGKLNSKETFNCPSDNWITGIKITLNGGNANDYNVAYEATYCFHKGTGRRYISVQAEKSKLLKVPNKHFSITSLRIVVVSKKQRKKERINRFIDMFKFNSRLYISKWFLKKVWYLFKIPKVLIK